NKALPEHQWAIKQPQSIFPMSQTKQPSTNSADQLQDRVRHLICLGCGYDLRASPGPDCPECGWHFGDQANLQMELGRALHRPSVLADPSMFAIPVANGLLIAA